uniref:DUF7597 domain-containing protein n=1 Tax=Setaria viridis TaxID=4556 RepID=A0A4U6WD44_SETVI|nr:hypothetical protein SEVIR_1G217300v2 [Setaria viridis]
MEVPNVDLHPGLSFATKPSSPTKFSLLASFPRSRIKLTVDNVGFILQSVLGDSSTLFDVSEVDDWVFLFSIASKEVGLLVYDLAPMKYGVKLDQNQCSRCLASSHTKAACLRPIRCGLCFRLGHSATLMAYKFVNLTSFLPRGCQRQVVGFRKPMSRVILGAPRRNQADVAITHIELLPQQHVTFQSIRELLEAFLVNHKRVAIHPIQPCPLDQAFVRFHFVHDKDFLIGGGPHDYGQYRITFTEHNKGWNNKLITMNCEVCIMLLGFNIVDSWIKGEEFEGNFWTVQVEILSYRLLGAGPADEGQPPDDVDPNLFDFFGYGQPSNVVGANVPNVGVNAINQAENDDLGDIENQAQAEAVMDDDEPAVDHAVDHVQIIEGTDSSSSDEPPPANFNFEPVDVNVFIPQDNGQPLHMLQDEVNVNELLDGQLNQDDDNIQAHAVNADMQLGIVALKNSVTSQPTIEAYRYWAKHFSSGDMETQVQFPLSWANFFVAQLLNPMNYTWLKISYPRQLWILYSQSKLFSLTCHLNLLSPCPQFKVSSSAGPWSKALLQKVEEVKKSQKVPVDLIFSDEELRRSKRVTSHNKGFRNSGCNDKNCIGCSANPPHLSQEVIRNLGEAFCKVDSS